MLYREPIYAALCRGSAGFYNMLQPEVADELGKQKVNNLMNTIIYQVYLFNATIDIN